MHRASSAGRTLSLAVELERQPGFVESRFQRCERFRVKRPAAKSMHLPLRRMRWVPDHRNCSMIRPRLWRRRPPAWNIAQKWEPGLSAKYWIVLLDCDHARVSPQALSTMPIVTHAVINATGQVTRMKIPYPLVRAKCGAGEEAGRSKTSWNSMRRPV